MEIKLSDAPTLESAMVRISLIVEGLTIGLKTSVSQSLLFYESL